MAIRVDRMTRIAGIAVVALALGASATSARAASASPGEATADATAPAIDDTTAPRGSVAGVRSPARGELVLEVDATDEGAGLAMARAIVDGTPFAQAALGAHQATRVPLRLDLTTLAVGVHRLQVRLADAAGNEADVYDGTIAISGPAPVLTPTVELTVGDPRAGGRSPASAVLSTGTAPACAWPRLSMMLDQRPLRVSRGRPVLRAGARYRFRGRLTCRVGGVRRSAPRGTQVEVLNRIGRRTFGVTGATTATGGRITMILAYRTSRTLVFRHRSATQTSEVRIRIVVVRRSGR